MLTHSYRSVRQDSESNLYRTFFLLFSVNSNKQDEIVKKIIKYKHEGGETYKSKMSCKIVQDN